MEAGKALGASLEIIKMIYETAETYRKLERLNQTVLNEIALLITLQDQIKNCRRMENNTIIDNYLIDINKRLEKFKSLIEEADKGNFFKKIAHTKKIKKISREIAEQIKKLKFLLDVKKEMLQSSKLDVANIITDIEARKFWENNFGSDHTFIQCNLFFSAIRMNTKLLTNEIDFVKKVINDDSDKYITAFEFQEWIDFFGDFSVVIRRTIDSLFDGNTYDIAIWYHKNISKTLVNALLMEHKFIIRKHTNQKGIFIANFIFNGEFCSLYIKNKDNYFWIEKVANMSVNELIFYEMLDIKKSSNLMEIANRLEYFLNPGEIRNTVNWQEEREKIKDQTILDEVIPKSIKDFVSSPIESLRSGLGNITDGIGYVTDGIGNITGEIGGIVNDGVDSFWKNFGCNKR